MKERNIKAQVAVFIILGLLVLVVLVVLFARGNFDTIFVSKTPFEEVENCAKEPIQEGIDKLSLQGGVIESENYYLYEGNNVEYVCYTDENLKECVMQRPILKNTIEEELANYAGPKIKDCLNFVKGTLEDGGYDVSMKDPDIEIEIVPDNVLVDIDIDFRATKDGTETYDHIRTGIKSKLYNFVIIESSIVNWETNYGDSETLNYMLYYPSLKVEKKKQSEGSTIYILTDRASEEKFYFAVRSFVIPPGVFEV